MGFILMGFGFGLQSSQMEELSVCPVSEVKLTPSSRKASVSMVEDKLKRVKASTE